MVEPKEPGEAMNPSYPKILLHPSLLFIIYLSSLFLRPWEILPDTLELKWIPQFLLGLTGFTSLLKTLLNSQGGRLRIQFRWSPACSACVALAIWLLGSTFKSANSSAAQSLFFLSAFRSILIFFLILYFIETESDYQKLLRGIVFSVLILTGFALSKNLASTDPSSRLQSAGLFADPNDLASILLMTLPFGLKIFKSLPRIIFLLIWSYAILKSSSRGALLGLSVLVVSFTILKIKKPAHRFAILGCALAVLGLVSGHMNRESEDLDQSASSRANYWKAGVNMALHQPVAGVGFGNYPIEFERYAPEIVYEWGERTAHSTWVLILAEGGLVGAGLFIAIFYSALKQAWHYRRLRPELLYSVLTYSTCMSFLSHTYTIFPWLLFGLIFAGTQSPELRQHRLEHA